MKLLVMQLSPPSCHSIPLWPKYSPQHPVLKHPQFMFLSYCQSAGFDVLTVMIMRRMALLAAATWFSTSQLSLFQHTRGTASFNLDRDDGDDIFLKDGRFISNYMALQHKRLSICFPSQCKFHVLIKV
jgi:hypothetical protein